jgi:hypothetical protein
LQRLVFVVRVGAGDERPHPADGGLAHGFSG